MNSGVCRKSPAMPGFFTLNYPHYNILYVSECMVIKWVWRMIFRFAMSKTWTLTGVVNSVRLALDESTEV